MLNPATGMDGDASSVSLDTDGSVTDTAGRYVVVNNPFPVERGLQRPDDLERSRL
jgi:hypothetical protein